MKKLLLILFLILFCNCLKTEAQIIVKNITEATVNENQIILPFSVNIFGENPTFSKLTVKPLDYYITHSSKPEFKIPTSKLYLNNGKNDYQMIQNSDILLSENENFIQSFIAKIENISALPAGIYSTRLQFNYTTNFGTETTIYNLIFNVPIKHSISCRTSSVEINPTPEDILNSKFIFTNSISPQLVIKSNTNWKLYLDTTNFYPRKNDYFVEIINTSNNIKDFIKEPIKLNENKKIMIAQGNSTFSEPIYGNYINDYLILRYFIKNNSSEIVESGIHNNQVKFILEEV